MSDNDKRIVMASTFGWNEESTPPRLQATFPSCRTMPNSSPNCAAFWMTEVEVRTTIRILQGCLLRTGRKMQEPLTDEQIAWATEPITRGDSNANTI